VILPNLDPAKTLKGGLDPIMQHTWADLQYVSEATSSNSIFQHSKPFILVLGKKTNSKPPFSSATATKVGLDSSMASSAQLNLNRLLLASPSTGVLTIFSLDGSHDSWNNIRVTVSLLHAELPLR